MQMQMFSHQFPRLIKTAVPSISLRSLPFAAHTILYTITTIIIEFRQVFCRSIDCAYAAWYNIYAVPYFFAAFCGWFCRCFSLFATILAGHKLRNWFVRGPSSGLNQINQYRCKLTFHINCNSIN